MFSSGNVMMGPMSEITILALLQCRIRQYGKGEDGPEIPVKTSEEAMASY